MAEIINNIAPPAGGGQILNNMPLPNQIAGVPHGERPPYTERWALCPGGWATGGEVKRTLTCEWSQVKTFPMAVLGDVAPGAGGGLSRTLPFQHPHTTKNLWASEMSLINGYGAHIRGDDGLIVFRDVVNNREGLAEWDVIFRQPKFVIAGPGGGEMSRYVSRAFAWSQEAYPLPGTSFVWEDDGAPIPEPAVKQRPLLELRMTWHWVPDPIPTARWINIVGRLNRTAFEGHPPGHVLAAAPEIGDTMATVSGRYVRDIVYVFLIRLDSPWTHFYKRLSGKFVRVIPNPQLTIGNPVPLYEEANFPDLFSL
jgi:hypothetical protein